MNCLSINVRGIGGYGKANWIYKIKVDCGISFIGLQESMSCNVHAGVISNYWGVMGRSLRRLMRLEILVV